MNKITKCPDCGAELNYDSDREFMFCQYCGAKIVVGEHKTYTEHVVNEAEILKEKRKIMELEQKAAKEKSDDKFGWFLFAFISFVVAISGFAIRMNGDSEERALGMLLSVAFTILGIIILIVGIRKK